MELRVCRPCRTLRPQGTLCPGCGGSVTLADETLFLGETFGKYRVEGVLGSGGMGVVYRARHVTLSKAAALKVLLPHEAGDEFEKRFVREAQVLADLKHPSIVEIYDFDLSPWGSPYYVMECLEGATLRRVVQSALGPVSLPVLAAILSDVVAGLGYAHRRGVVHRDLKPDNLFVATYDGRAVVKILDFGIAKLLQHGEDHVTTGLTSTGIVVGTPNYLAPEQILGTGVGAFTDQYALALVVAELLSGRPVRTGKTLGQIVGTEIRHSLDLARLPADLPPALGAALCRATEPDPQARFPDIQAFLAGLDLPEVAGADERLADALMALGTDEKPEPTPIGPATGTLQAELQETKARKATIQIAPPTWSQWPPSGERSVEDRPKPLGGRSLTAVARWGLLAFAGALIVLVGWWAMGRSRREGPVMSAPGLRSALAVAPDVTRILGLVEDTVILEGGGALYLLPLTEGAVASRVPLADGEHIVGRGEDGSLFLLQGERLTRLAPLRQERAVIVERLRVDDAPDVPVQARVRVSETGDRVATLRAKDLEVCAVEASTCRPFLHLPRAGGGSLEFALGRRFLAVAQATQEVAVFDLETGRQVFTRPFGEAKVHALALLEDAGLLAVGGWFDHVDLYPLRPDAAPRVIRRQGRILDLAWVPDRPTLVLGTDDGVRVWREADGEVALGTGGFPAAHVLFTRNGLLALDGQGHRLLLFDSGSFPVAGRTRVSQKPLWALASLPGGQAVLAGGQDGTIYRHDWPAGRTEPFAVHTDGVTSLVAAGDRLASTSDDKSLAIWGLPRMNVLWRSQAHGYLINQLELHRDSASLWSSSSDGTVKRWGWPEPAARESLDTTQLFGRRYSLQALWVSAREDRLLVGSWNHALLELRRADGAWKGQALPVASQALYQRAEAPGVGAVVFAGMNPHRVYVYDLTRDALRELPDFGLDVYALVPGRQGEVYGLGAGAILRYVLSREAGHTLAYQVAAGVDARLGELLCGDLSTDGSTLVAGSDAGELLLVERRHLETPPLARGVVP